jgi:hypothetical protein
MRADGSANWLYQALPHWYQTFTSRMSMLAAAICPPEGLAKSEARSVNRSTFANG